MTEVLSALRGLHRGEPARPPVDWRALAQAADAHGLAIVLLEHLRPALPADAARWLDFRVAAAGMRHHALLAALWEVLGALDAAGVRVVSLKGPLLAERLYVPAAARSCVDLDVLIDPEHLDRATTALVSLGYSPPPASDIAYYRVAHHHLIFTHPRRDPVELHFLAQSSFGARIPSVELLDRAVPVATPFGPKPWVLQPTDEFAYLAAHAAAHRFLRWGWVHDLALLARAHAVDAGAVLVRARTLGVDRAVRATLGAVAEIGYDVAGAPPLTFRSRVALSLRGERGPAIDALTMLATELTLADSGRAAARHLRRKLAHDLPMRLKTRR